MRVLRARSGTCVAAALVFVALPAVVLALTDEEAASEGIPPWNQFTAEEIHEHMSWDEEATEKRREWVQNSRQSMAIALAKRLRLGKGGTFGGYELLVEEMVMPPPPNTDGSKRKTPQPRWRHRCLNANITYDKVDQCAGRMLVTLGSMCAVQADPNTAQPFLKKTIKEHMKVINSGMVYELGVLRRKQGGVSVWGMSPALLTDMLQKQAEGTDEIVTEAVEFSMHLLIQAAMMFVYFSCANALGIQSYWEQGQELFSGITSHYDEKKWEGVGVPQDQAYHLIRVIGQSVALTKGQGEIHSELQKYMEGYTNFVWGYWRDWMESGSHNTQYDGCEAVAQGVSWQCLSTKVGERDLIRNEKWFEDMLTKNFHQITPTPEAIRQEGVPKIMVHSCGVLLFFSSWIKMTKNPGMTIQLFRDIKTSLEQMDITQEKFDKISIMEKLKNAEALVGSMMVLPQIMYQTKRFSYRIDDTSDCMDALGLALQIIDDPPPNMPLRPIIPEGHPLRSQPMGKGVPQDDLEERVTMDDFNLGHVNDGIHAEL